jgi:hypothetical protein
MIRYAPLASSALDVRGAKSAAAVSKPLARFGAMEGALARGLLCQALLAPDRNQHSAPNAASKIDFRLARPR